MLTLVCVPFVGGGRENSVVEQTLAICGSSLCYLRRRLSTEATQDPLYYQGSRNESLYISIDLTSIWHKLLTLNNLLSLLCAKVVQISACYYSFKRC